MSIGDDGSLQTRRGSGNKATRRPERAREDGTTRTDGGGAAVKVARRWAQRHRHWRSSRQPEPPRRPSREAPSRCRAAGRHGTARPKPHGDDDGASCHEALGVLLELLAVCAGQRQRAVHARVDGLTCRALWPTRGYRTYIFYRSYALPPSRQQEKQLHSTASASLVHLNNKPNQPSLATWSKSTTLPSNQCVPFPAFLPHTANE